MTGVGDAGEAPPSIGIGGFTVFFELAFLRPGVFSAITAKESPLMLWLVLGKVAESANHPITNPSAKTVLRALNDNQDLVAEGNSTILFKIIKNLWRLVGG